MDPKRLIVIVPGFGGHSRLWAPLRARLDAEAGFSPEETCWLPFEHGSKWYSVGGLSELGAQLNARIAAECIRYESIKDVVLIGHSMGGLIARQAYLLGSGGVPGKSPGQWTTLVSRIVLMASVNRGVDLERASWIAGLGAYLFRVLPFVPHLRMSDLLRGSNFLTNVRINWIRHFGRFGHSGDEAPSKRPLVIQVLGTDDGLVSPDDSRDILAFPNGHYLEVPGANHSSIFRLDLTPDPDLRYSILRRSLTASFEPKASVTESHNPICRVVFLLHGIRASNVDGWVNGLEKRILSREGTRVVVKNPTYGYFSAARFALPSVRRKNIKIFQDWYTEALAENPAAEFDVIAHSNGTYLLGHSLLNTPGMKFTNVALAGSVLPEDFWQRFKELRTQVTRIRNDRANRDWPVALLCNGLRGLRMRDVGTAGFSGFHGDVAEEIAYYAGGHGEALKEENLDKLVDFALNGTVSAPSNLTTPGYYRQLSNIMPYVAMAALLLITVATASFVLSGGQFDPMRAFAVVLVILAVYVVLDIV